MSASRMALFRLRRSCRKSRLMVCAPIAASCRSYSRHVCLCVPVSRYVTSGWKSPSVPTGRTQVCYDTVRLEGSDKLGSAVGQWAINTRKCSSSTSSIVPSQVDILWDCSGAGQLSQHRFADCMRVGHMVRAAMTRSLETRRNSPHQEKPKGFRRDFQRASPCVANRRCPLCSVRARITVSYHCSSKSDQSSANYRCIVP